MKLPMLLLAAAAYASATCPTWVGRPEVYPIGSVLEYNGANYEVIRDLGNGWINPSDAWFWSATTNGCDGTTPGTGTGGVVTEDLSQVLANQATILSLLQELKDGQAQIRTDVAALGVKGQFTDNRDGQVYRTIRIGTQVWMAQNLNYATASSVCYNNDPAQCAIYGRLYDWDDAMTACPAGWHLPTREEWAVLDAWVDNANGGTTNDEGTSLKSATLWSSGAGTDAYGWSGLPGGNRSFGSFYSQGNYGYWWSASQSDATNAWTRILKDGYAYLKEDNIFKSFGGFSTRCLQD